MRWIAVLAVLLAVLSASSVASGAATTSASPQADAAKRLNALVRHTRALPKRLVKPRHKLALVRLAKSAKRTSRRRPCRSVRTLRTYRLLGDPSAQAWVNTPVEIDVTKIVAELIPMSTPGPGPSFRVRVDIGEQGIGTPTVVTLYHRGEAVGRGTVGKGAVEITPEVAIGRDSLNVVFEQDRALPAQKAVSP